MCVLSSLFFFSSRRRHTRSLCDWSSDVCSSDLSVETYSGTAVGINRGDRIDRQAAIQNLVALRSEEHTSELQSHSDLVCRLLLEKKKEQGRERTDRKWRSEDNQLRT